MFHKNFPISYLSYTLRSGKLYVNYIGSKKSKDASTPKNNIFSI